MCGACASVATHVIAQVTPRAGTAVNKHTNCTRPSTHTQYLRIPREGQRVGAVGALDALRVQQDLSIPAVAELEGLVGCEGVLRPQAGQTRRVLHGHVASRVAQRLELVEGGHALFEHGVGAALYAGRLREAVGGGCLDEDGGRVVGHVLVAEVVEQAQGGEGQHQAERL